MCDQQRLRPVCIYAQPDQSLCSSLDFSMSVKLLTEHHLEFLSLKGGCTGSSESTLAKCHIVGNHKSRLICMDHMCVSEMEARMFKILRAYRANEDPVLGELRGKVISTLSKEEIVTEMTTLGIDVARLCKIGGLQEETIMDKNNCILLNTVVLLVTRRRILGK